MTVDPLVLTTIILMALVTYATRLGGFLLLSRLNLTGRVEAWLRYIPGAVLFAIIAPTVVPANLMQAGTGSSGVLTGGIAEMLAAAVALLVAGRTKNLLLTMISGVLTVWMLRHLF